VCEGRSLVNPSSSLTEHKVLEILFENTDKRQALCKMSQAKRGFGQFSVAITYNLTMEGSQLKASLGK
jgi:hypothetical protein